MTAIGFLLFVIGFVLVRYFGSPYYTWEESNMADKIGVPTGFIGMVLILAGVSTKLWEIMP